MILQRYLLREIVQAVVAVLVVLVLIYVSNRFVRVLTEAAAGNLASDLILDLVALKLVANLALLLPAAFYIAVLISLGRFYKDSEMVAMWAGGWGLDRVAQTLAWVSGGVALVVLALSLYVGPGASAMYDRLIERARNEAEIAGLIPGRFREFGSNDSVIYVEDVAPDRRAMRNVFVRVRGDGRSHVLVARRGYLSLQGGEGDRFMVLEDGYRYTGEPGRVDYVVTRFQRHAVRLDRINRSNVWFKRTSTPTADLLRSGTGIDVAEFQWRVSLGLSVMLLGMLAIPLSRTSPREGKYARLFTAVIVYFVYNNLLGVMQKLVERGELSPAVGVWPVHLVLGVGTVLWIYLQGAGRWRLARTALRQSEST